MKRLYNFNCPNCGLVEMLEHENVNTKDCIKCGNKANKSTKPNRVKGRVIGGCDNDSIKGLN